MLTRRRFLEALAAGAAGGATLIGGRTFAQNEKPRVLIVIGGTGGASIIDAMLAIRHGESANAPTLNCFPDGEVVDIADSPFRAVELSQATLQTAGFVSIPLTFDPSTMRNVIDRRKNDMLVATMTGTSVNHVVAQKRALTGNAAWNGRTLQEAVAERWGDGMLLPNVNMAWGGYQESGTDSTLSAYAQREPLAAHPVFWTFSTHGSKGIKDLPSPSLIEAARNLRNDALDPASPTYTQRIRSEKVLRWMDQRGAGLAAIEDADLITKLQFAPNQPGPIPLAEYGLAESPDGPAIRSVFPNWLDDPLEAQAALAFLLVKNGLSASVTISPTFNPVLVNGGSIVNPPLSFDYSHQNHRYAQAAMWARVMSVADRLIGLLQGEIDGDGESLWSRSMIYVATDFGRTRPRPTNMERPEGDPVFGSGHDLNNGVVVFSPLVQGNTLLGGVDPNSGMTYGFDRTTGAARPTETMTEPDIFAGLLQALDVDTSGTSLPDVPAIVRG